MTTYIKTQDEQKASNRQTFVYVPVPTVIRLRACKDHQLVLDVHRATQHFPDNEKRKIAQQMRWLACTIEEQVDSWRRRCDRITARHIITTIKLLHHLKIQTRTAHALGYLSADLCALLERRTHLLEQTIRGLKN